MPLAKVKTVTVDGDLLKIAAGATNFSLALGREGGEGVAQEDPEPAIA